MASKEDIRPTYAELQGYLSQAPSEEKSGPIRDANLWNQVNETIDELNRISGEDYDRFKITPQRYEHNRIPYLDKDTYRSKLGGLISRLHGIYFSDEVAPFSGIPSTVIIKSQKSKDKSQKLVVARCSLHFRGNLAVATILV